MSRQWTDADVARMLGWYFEPDGRYRPCKYGEVNLEFGLSTPPGPDADANAARYVLPWLREEIPGRGDIVIDVLIAKCAMDESKGFDYNEPESLIAWMILICDGPTLCTAALEAYHAGRQDNGK